MKKYNKIILTLGLAVTLFSSCHMEVEPETAVLYDPDKKDMISNADELEYFVNGLYSSFRSTQYGSATMPMEYMCDGFNASVAFGNNMGPIHRTDDTFRATDYDTEYVYEVNYSAIKNYNVFLEQVELYDPAGDEYAEFLKEVGIGEAKFFRAFAYLTLVRHFAKPYRSSTAATDPGVPVVLKYDQDEKPVRASVKAVYDQIKKDLDDAYDIIVNYWGISGEARSAWVTEDAINALYARYYLDTEQYAEAARKAAIVINTGKYELASDFNSMVQEYTYDQGNEPIMQLAGQLSENGAGTNTYYTRTSFSQYVKDKGISSTGNYFTPYFFPSGKLIDQYEDNDLRWITWYWNYTKPSDLQYALYLSGQGYAGPRLAQLFPVFIKYLGNPSLQSTSTPNARQLVKPLLISEMYLIAAEAYYMSGDAADAADYLNELQESRGATATAATQENIENEWFKETVGEGLRMSCLKRWGHGYTARYGVYDYLYYGSINVGADYTDRAMAADDRAWQWPIPSWEMRTNDNMVQNPGY